MFWGYVRRKMTEAILGGVQDAIEQIEQPGAVESPETLATALMQRLRLKEIAQEVNGRKAGGKLTATR